MILLLPLRQHCRTSLIADFIPQHIRNIPDLDIVCTILQNPFHCIFLAIYNQLCLFHHLVINLLFFCIVNILQPQPMGKACFAQLIFPAAISTAILGNIFPIADINSDMSFLPHSRPDRRLSDGRNRMNLQSRVIVSL